MARELPIRVGGVKNTYEERTSMEVSKATLEGAGAETGHGLLIAIYLERTGKTIACEGATELSPEQKQTTSFRSAVFYIAEWNGSSAVKVTWTSSEKTSCELAIEVVRGHDVAHLSDATAVWTEGASTKSITATGITTESENALQFLMQNNSNGSTFNVAPSGFTVGLNASPGFAYRAQETAGATGTSAVELSASATKSLILNMAVRGATIIEGTSGVGMVI